MPKTSWSNDDLKKLTNPLNHRIIYDGYNFVWEHNINDKWELHCIKLFNDYKKPYSWLMECISNWSKEIKERELKESRQHFKQMFKDLKIKQNISIAINEIAKEHHTKTKEKIKMIRNINPNLSSLEIAEILGISKRAVNKYS